MTGHSGTGIEGQIGCNRRFSVVDVDEDEISKKLLDFELDAVVVVPEGYTEGILGGNAAAIEIVSLKGKVQHGWSN